jgi:hypothetical protein
MGLNLSFFILKGNETKTEFKKILAQVFILLA